MSKCDLAVKCRNLLPLYWSKGRKTALRSHVAHPLAFRLNCLNHLREMILSPFSKTSKNKVWITCHSNTLEQACQKVLCLTLMSHETLRILFLSFCSPQSLRAPPSVWVNSRRQIAERGGGAGAPGILGKSNPSATRIWRSVLEDEHANRI